VIFSYGLMNKQSSYSKHKKILNVRINFSFLGLLRTTMEDDAALFIQVYCLPAGVLAKGRSGGGARPRGGRNVNGGVL